MNVGSPDAALAAGEASEAEIVASVGLGLLPGIGPRTIARWLGATRSAQAVWHELPAWVQTRRNCGEIVAAWRTLEPRRIVDAALARGIGILAWRDGRYPQALRRIVDAPAALFVRGAGGGRLNDHPAVAVVGARRATPYGRAAAAQLAFDLARAGVAVVSGFARGIDGAAHEAALEGGGTTIGVLGCGVDVVYPREHRALAAKVAHSGALVSEFPPATPPLPHHFPRRNRLISGLAAGVIVVEGGEDSGAMITVDYALDQGREVFAVPGSIFSAKSRAPHRLLRQGARLVEGAHDVLDELGLASSASSASTAEPARADGGGRSRGGERTAEATVLAALDTGPLAIDDVVEICGLPASRVAATVTELELGGLIRMLPGQMLLKTPRGGAG
jgi:DNA processing protein